MKLEDMAILIVDDEFSVRDSLRRWFKAYGCTVDVAEDANQALKKLQEQAWDIVFIDIKLPGVDGIELNRRINAIDENIIKVVITAFPSVDSAIQALKEGAYDYITKPIDPAKLDHVIRNAVEKRRLIRETQALKKKVEELIMPDLIVGDSEPMKRVMQLIQEVAQTDVTVMIRGESGTGKELVARAIHANSTRRYFPSITINCGAYPEGLLESEMFGHEKGAFTGALYRRRGKLELADKGTIFFDEIGTISSKMQLDLLRVIETKQFTRLGGEKMTTVDFRVISATNEDLEQAVKAGPFREDLYYRLHVFSISIPPLRERKEDIPLLADYFLKRLAQSMNKKTEGFTEGCMKTINQYEWPGNVRELKNVIERALVVAKGKRLDSADLSFPFVLQKETDLSPEQKECTLEELEKQHIKRVLEATSGNISHAAKILGIERVTLYNKLKKYNLA
jgi:DNA-binding NtrC family response regulator